MIIKVIVKDPKGLLKLHNISYDDLGLNIYFDRKEFAKEILKEINEYINNFEKMEEDEIKMRIMDAIL